MPTFSSIALDAKVVFTFCRLDCSSSHPSCHRVNRWVLDPMGSRSSDSSGLSFISLAILISPFQ
jgi:hypothetical protein